MELGGTVDLRYVTIAGNTVGIGCGADATGTIRNSIITNVGNSVDGFCPLSFVDNAIDESGMGGTEVPSFDPTWFVVSNGSRFFLSDAGQAVFADIADWDEGDPLTDIEGDLRPTETPGFPGVDEPEAR